MSREVHVRFCEGLGVRFPRATRRRLCLAVTQSLLGGDSAEAASLLKQLAADPKLTDWLRPFVEALQAIVAGRRDRTLADNPELSFTSVAEILLLLETLEQQ